VGGQPCGVAGAAGGVWVSDADGGRLLLIDAATGVARQVAKLDPTPCEIAVGFGSLWVVTQSGRVDRVDPRTGRVVARVKVGATSYEAVVAAGSLWVSNRNDGTVQRIDPHTNLVVQTVRMDGNPGGLVYAAGALWVGDDMSGSNRLFRVDVRTGHVTRVRAGNRPGYVASAGGSIWVSNVDDGTVTQLDPESRKSVRTIDVGLSPVNLVGTSGPTPEVWVPDDAGNAVVRINARTGRITGRLTAEGGPAVATPVGADVWVSLFEGAAVLRLRAA
jgi:YVTN family beta-propeller protein